MEHKTAGQPICSEETVVIDFIKRVIEKSNGEIPVHRLKIQLEPLPKPMKQIIGGFNHKQLTQFLTDHNKHFVVRFGVAYLAQNDSCAQYGRVFTDIYGQFVTKRKIRLLTNNSFAFVTKLSANREPYEVGDYVKCNVSTGANQLIATHLRATTAAEIDADSTKPPNDEKTRQPAKKSRKKGKKKKPAGSTNVQECVVVTGIDSTKKKPVGATKCVVGATNSGECVVDTGTSIDYTKAKNLQNVAGSVAKLTHQDGRLWFVDGKYTGEVLFVIDDYYENEKKVLNLEWYLKVGDEVLFDAILEAGFRWKGLVVWKGSRPQVTTIIDKKRRLEEYLERNNPLVSMDLCLNVHSGVPIVTVGGKKASKKGNLVAKGGTKPGRKPKCDKTGSKTQKSDDFGIKRDQDALCKPAASVFYDLYCGFEDTGAQNDLVNKQVVAEYSPCAASIGSKPKLSGFWDLVTSGDEEEPFKPLMNKSGVKSVSNFKDTTYGSMDDIESAGTSKNGTSSNISVIVDTNTNEEEWNYLDKVDSGSDIQAVITQQESSDIIKKSKDEANKCSTEDHKTNEENDCCKCVCC